MGSSALCYASSGPPETEIPSIFRLVHIHNKARGTEELGRNGFSLQIFLGEETPIMHRTKLPRCVSNIS